MMPPILCRIFVACLTLSLAMTVSIAMAQDDAGLTPQVANTFVSTDDTELAQLFTAPAPTTEIPQATVGSQTEDFTLGDDSEVVLMLEYAATAPPQPSGEFQSSDDSDLTKLFTAPTEVETLRVQIYLPVISSSK